MEKDKGWQKRQGIARQIKGGKSVKGGNGGLGQ